MFCKKCGAELSAGSRFCKKCGTPAERKTADVQAVPTAPLINPSSNLPTDKKPIQPKRIIIAVSFVAIILAAVLCILLFTRSDKPEASIDTPKQEPPIQKEESHSEQPDKTAEPAETEQTAQEIPVSEQFDMTPYIGTWAEEGYGWQYGGMTLSFSIDGDLLVLALSDNQSAPNCRVAGGSASIPLQDIHGDTFTWQVDEDGWGNSCSVEIKLCGDYLTVVISDLHSNIESDSAWGLSEGQYFLYRNDFTAEAMYYTPEMYAAFSGNNARPDAPPNGTSITTADGLLTVSETSIFMQNEAVLYVSINYESSVSWSCDSSIISMTWGEWDASGTVPLYITGIQNGSTVLKISDTNYPNEYIEVSITVSGLGSADTLTASVIFASSGITEAQFKQNCEALFLNVPTDLAMAMGEEFYAANPDQDPRDYILSGNTSLGLYSSPQEQADSGQIIKGSRILRNATDEKLEHMLTYPNDYIGNSYHIYGLVIDSKQVDDSTGYTYYTAYDNDKNFLLYDYRDDIYNPTISLDNQINVYAVYDGVSTHNLTGQDYYTFIVLASENFVK